MQKEEIMSNKQLRNTIRIVHLIVGALMIAFIYAEPLRASTGFVTFMQFVAIPMVVISGVAMWQQAALSKLRRRTA
jgi:thiosulfate reductase cytochrome b subunit